MTKIKVYHFHNGKGGGVLSVIKNLLKYSQTPAIENHVIYTINKLNQPNYAIHNLKGALSEQVFYYSSNWNFYYISKMLAKLLPDEQAIVVAHDWLELGVLSSLGLRNRVVMFLHGDYDYYYQLARAHDSAINQFITVASNIKNRLKVLLPNRANDVIYLRFPVPDITFKKEESFKNNIIFIGRLTEDKGYHLLPVIDELLKNENIFLHWHIVGNKPQNSNCKASWGGDSSVQLYGDLKNEEVFRVLQSMDFFILPSLAEGMPISLIEAMKAGVIPLVNDINGGIEELVTDNITGLKIANNQPWLYARGIRLLIKQKEKFAEISANCSSLANELFSPIKNTILIEHQITELYRKPVRYKPSKRIYGSLLDQPWIPNFITRALRVIKSCYKNA